MVRQQSAIDMMRRSTTHLPRAVWRHTSIDAEHPASCDRFRIHCARDSALSVRKVYERFAHLITNWASSKGPTNCVRDTAGGAIGARRRM